MIAVLVFGLACAFGGIAGLLWCAVLARRIGRGAYPEAEARARLQRLVVLNTAALGTGMLGAALVLLALLLQG